MTLRRFVLATILMGPLACPAGLAGQAATIRPSPEAPLSPTPRTEGELEAYFEVQNASAPVTRLSRVETFKSQYIDSEFRHLILFIDWQTRLELGRTGDEIIDAALEGIEAQDHFLSSKLGFVPDPSGLEELPALRFTLEDRKAGYYRSIVDTYRAQGDFDRVIEFAELALASMDEAWDLFETLAEEGDEQYELVLGQQTDARLFVLHSLMEGYQNAGEVEKIVETGEAILQLEPLDLQTLMTTSLLMAEPPPDAEAVSVPDLRRAEGYAAEAVRQMTAFLDGPGAEEFDDLEKSELLAEVYTTLGIITYQLEDWPAAADAYRASVEALPEGSSYYMLGLASYNNRNIEDTLSAFARAVYLDFPDPQARSSLEVLFEAVNGSVDGLEEFVQSEGAQISN